jgi:hypothetical protein
VGQIPFGDVVPSVGLSYHAGAPQLTRAWNGAQAVDDLVAQAVEDFGDWIVIDREGGSAETWT